MRQYVARILRVLFPCINEAISHPGDRRILPIGNSEFFSRYFQFSPLSNTISNPELHQWLEKARDADAFGSVLLKAREQGLLREQMYLDRLQDHIMDIQEKDIPVVISALLDIGDNLIESPRKLDEGDIFFNDNLLVTNLDLSGRRFSLEDRLPTFERSIRNGNALTVQCRLLERSEKDIKNGREPLIPDEELPRFKALWLEKVNERTINNTLLSHQNLMPILDVWQQWSSDDSKIKKWCAKATASDDGMFAFMEKFICERIINTRKTYSINLESMKKYIDITAFEKRICVLQAEDKISQEFEEVVKLFLQGIVIARGQES